MPLERIYFFLILATNQALFMERIREEENQSVSVNN
jgi:hypothetical protein